MMEFHEKASAIYEDIGGIMFDHLPETGWTRAYIDFRAAQGARMGKGRYVKDDGSLGSFKTGGEILELCRQLQELSKQTKGGHWFGMVFNITPDGDFSIDYNYDKDCVADSTFYSD